MSEQSDSGNGGSLNPPDPINPPPPIPTLPYARPGPPPIVQPADPQHVPFAAFAPPPPRRTPRSRASIIIGCVAVVIVCGGLALALKVYRDRNPVLPGRQYESVQQKYEKSSAIFGKDQTLQIDAAEKEALRSMFARLSGAARRNDANGFAACFDYDRMIDEVILTQLPGVDALKSDQARQGFRQGVRQSTPSSLANYAFGAFDIRQVQPIAGAPEAIVYMRVRDDDGVAGKLRWWVRKVDGNWRVYDLENLQSGVRVTTLTAAVMPAASGPGASAIKAVMSAVNRANQQMLAEDPAGAAKTLDAAADPSLPGSIEALRLTILMGCQMELDEFDKALKTGDRAIALNPDIPIVDLLRGRAFNAVGEPAKALAALDRYEASLGAEAISLWNRGEALLSMDKRDEALACFRKGLDDDGESADNLAALCKVLGSEGLPELKGRLAKFPDKMAAVATAANFAFHETDLRQLEAAVALYDGIDPQRRDARTIYARAELHVLRREWPEAVKAFEANLTLLRNDPYSATAVDAEYATALLNGGRPLDAYRLRKDKPQAMDDVGGQLTGHEDAKGLDALVELHRTSSPGDAQRLHYYSGAAAELRKEFIAAEAAYRRALASAASDEWREAAGSSLARILFLTERATEAYRTIPPKEQTLATLLHLARTNEKPAVLRSLADARQAEAPTDPMPDWYRSEAAWMEKDYAECARLLLSLRDTLAADDRTKWTFEYRLIRALVKAGRPSDAVAQAKLFEGHGSKMQYLHAIAWAAAGDVPQATRRLEQLLMPAAESDDEGSLTFEDMLEDEDLAKALSAPAFADWVRQHRQLGPSPRPQTRPATRP